MVRRTFLIISVKNEAEHHVFSSSGGEAERPGSFCHVSVPCQIKGMDADENELLHFPEPLFRGD